MTISKLFMSHYNGYAAEVGELVTELRLRGVVPWVDKDGGFTVGDHSEVEARRAIREDCFGLALYASSEVFERPFIRDVEMDEAKRTLIRSDDFIVFALPRSLSFEELARRSVESFALDLSPYHTHKVSEGDLDSFCTIAAEIVTRVLRRAAQASPTTLHLQYSTREIMPDHPLDVLCINAVPLLADAPTEDAVWLRTLAALQDVKAAIAGTLGRPRLAVGGSKHLTAAFMFGRVFAPFELDIRQTPTDWWSTDCPAALPPLATTLSTLDDGAPALVVEVVGRYKNVGAGVDECFRTAGTPAPIARLHLEPVGPPLNIDNAICRAMATQVYDEIEEAIQSLSRRGTPAQEIHLFVSAPQSFMMMLGREFKGMPPVVVYEWTGEHYVRACRLPGGIL